MVVIIPRAFPLNSSFAAIFACRVPLLSSCLGGTGFACGCHGIVRGRIEDEGWFGGRPLGQSHGRKPTHGVRHRHEARKDSAVTRWGWKGGSCAPETSALPPTRHWVAATSFSSPLEMELHANVSVDPLAAPQQCIAAEVSVGAMKEVHSQRGSTSLNRVACASRSSALRWWVPGTSSRRVSSAPVRGILQASRSAVRCEMLTLDRCGEQQIQICRERVPLSSFAEQTTSRWKLSTIYSFT